MKKKKTTDYNKYESNNKRKIMLLNFNRWNLTDFAFVLYDSIAVSLAYFLALWLRFDCRYTEIPGNYLMAWLKFAPIYALVSVLVFWIFRLYRSLWRFASFVELNRVACASGI